MNKKILIFIILLFCMCTLVGCGEINMSMFEGLEDDMRDRFKETWTATNMLAEQGFISGTSPCNSCTNKMSNPTDPNHAQYVTCSKCSTGSAGTIRQNIVDFNDTWGKMASTTYKGKKEDEIHGEIAKLLKNEKINITEAFSAVRCILHGVTYNYTGDDKGNAVSDYIVCHYLGMEQNGGYSGSRWLFKANTIADGEPKPPTHMGGKTTMADGILTKLGDTTCTPIEIVPSGVQDELNETLDFPIYVLRPDVYSQLGSSSLDDLYKKIQGAILDNEGNLRKDIGDNELAKYFYPVRVEIDKGGYKSTEQLTLRHLAKNNSILGDWNNILLTTTWNNAKADDIVRNKVGQDIIVYQEIKVNGKDCTCSGCQTGYIIEPVLSLRLREYNLTAVENLNNALGLFNSDGKAGRYVVSRDSHGDGNKIYLLEYPVYAIDGFQAKNVKGSEFTEAIFTPSGIGINILTGSIIKYNTDSSGNYLTSGTYITEDADNYYTSAIFGDSSGKSSFSVFGYTEEMVLDLASMKSKTYASGLNLGTYYDILTARIVLNDYLEATYAPEYNSESKVVVFGRKIRFYIGENIVVKDNKNTYGFSAESQTFNSDLVKSGDVTIKTSIAYQATLIFDRKEDVAIYIDKDGNTKSRTLKIYDFCDINALTLGGQTSNSFVEELENASPGGGNNTEKPCDTVITIVKDGEIPHIVDAKEKTYSKISEPSELKNISIDSGSTPNYIQTSAVFPSNKIGTTDYKNYVNSTDGLPSQQRFWVMTVRTGIFDSGLFTMWINSTSESASLLWWNKYLQSNGFKYNVGMNETFDYLLSSYKTQLQKSGVVLIDLETIKDLQEMFEKEDDLARVKTIRTTFVVIGWGIAASALVLLVLWAIDTNTDLGLNLLGKVTFGHWTAVKYDSDIPENTDGKCYLTGGKVLIRCLILIAVGIILIMIDVINLVSTLIYLFGRIASTIEKVIRGI